MPSLSVSVQKVNHVLQLSSSLIIVWVSLTDQAQGLGIRLTLPVDTDAQLVAEGRTGSQEIGT